VVASEWLWAGGLIDVSLPFQYTRRRMEIPVRSVHCYHLQCFDLRNYLGLNEKNPRWKCPECGVSALHSELRVDE
jgi:MIZ/SP-RING zinc finger